MNREDLLIEAGELLAHIGDANLRLYDASPSDDGYRQGHLPGAAFFDHARFSDPNSLLPFTVLPPAELAASMGRIGISNDSPVVVYACGLLPYAARALWVLRYAGHDNVRLLNGGLSAWKQAGGALDLEPRAYAPAAFTARPRPGMFQGKEAVQAALQDASACVVNVLPADSFAGAHIPGSANLSCFPLLADLDTLAPNDRLAAHLQDQARYRQVITYCGGGIAAVVNALALLMLGQDNAAVYDGSLYEWEAAGLPIEGTGDWQGPLLKLMGQSPASQPQ